LWLREGILLAGIANKFMLSTWHEEGNLQSLPGTVTQEEIDLLT